MSEKNIVVYRLDPGNAKGLRPETLAKIEAMTDEDIERAAAEDPDAAIFTEEELSQFPDGIDPLDVIQAEKELYDLLQKYPPDVLKMVGVTAFDVTKN